MLTTNARRTDPSRTQLVRLSYERACTKRLTKLRRDMSASITTRDAFGLGSTPFLLRANEMSGVQQFAFTSDARKHDEFMDWLRQQIELEVLEIVDREGRPRESTWQDAYIRAAYERGATQAIADVRKRFPQAAPVVPVGASFFFQPIHQRALEVLYTRNFEALKGVTDAMASGISRELTLGFAQGLSPIQIAKNLRDRVNKIGLVRARVMARTEVIHAHAQATLNVYEQMGIEEIEAEVEISTAGDARVCPKCRGLVGKVFSIKKARGIIPLHPACRCRWLAVVKDTRKKAA